jgi:uncharacterized protein (DUF1501 family)
LTLGPALYLAPSAVLRRVYASPLGAPRNVVFVELFGGNDGLNTIVPYGVQGGLYYTEYRGQIAVPEHSILKVAGNTELGFHPALVKLKSSFDAGRLAVVHGVSYPNPSFSHDKSQLIWAYGDPTLTASKSWLASYVDAQPVAGLPMAADLFDHLTPAYANTSSFIPAFASLESMAFPYDPEHPADKGNRRAAYEAILEGHAPLTGLSTAMSNTGLGVLGMIDTLAGVSPAPKAAAYPNTDLATALKLALDLFHANLGVRVLHVGTGGFDTHAKQNDDAYHAKLLTNVSESLGAFQSDLEALGLDSNTIVVVYSEFGRTVYENGSGGSDHGSVNPVLVLGTPVIGGFVNEHPSMDPATLTPQGELPMMADFRDVLGTIGVKWLEQPAGSLFHNFTATPMGFLP